MTAPWYPPVKRTIDVVGASLGLVVLSPVMAVVAGLVRAKLGAPILFRQQRPGRDGRVFELLKFRTMSPADPSTAPAPDDERLGSFGRALRASSLDELPTLLNVLRGDMSLVGPRPLLVEYLDLYSTEQRRRHEVRPGITGLAQVHGRNLVDWDRRLELDVTYVDRVSPSLDLWILWRTVGVALRRTGINAEGEATMKRFEGSA